jgi:hypothetical protein
MFWGGNLSKLFEYNFIQKGFSRNGDFLKIDPWSGFYESPFSTQLNGKIMGQF